MPLETIAFGSDLRDRHRRLYSVVLHAYLLLTPEFGILEANPAYLDATLSDLALIKHRQISDAFPDNPGDPEASGMRDLLASLQTVLKEKKSNTVPRQRYDVRNQEGVWETTHWKSTNMPVLDDDGKVDFIIHSIEDAVA